MALAPGTRLGSYRIEQPLGVGGMGEVYRARDTRLNRDVAVKVVTRALADTPGLRERFEHEARSVAALNHPNICTLYDIGRDGDVDYLVMEFLEGRTLADCLGARRALPVDEATAIAIQISTRSTPRTGAAWCTGI